jgi:hypothetical protein
MVVKGFKHNGYYVYPAAQQLRKDDGSPGDWYGIASIVRYRGNEPPLFESLHWGPPPTFMTEQEAKDYAVVRVRAMIDEGRVNI